MKYVIARYYFDSLFKEEADSNFIDDIQRNPVFRVNSFSYAIGHVHVENEDGVTYVRGQIGRIPVEEEGYVYDEGSKDFIASTRDSFADTILEFCIIPSRHILLIEDNNAFKATSALSKFRQIYLQSNESYVRSFSIDFVFNEIDVYQEISSWQQFKKVVFSDLRPSNPDPNDDYAFIEELIKDTASARTKIEFKTDEVKDTANSLNMDSQLISQGLSLSAHGYGNARIIGVDEGGAHKEVKTTKFRKTVEIDFREDGSISKILQITDEVGGVDE
jgi:hypothetical protein